MTTVRKSFDQVELESPRGQLNGLWKSSMQFMSTVTGGSLLVDQDAEIHERICKMKKWADLTRKQLGYYPDVEVRDFVASLSTSSAH
jgi:hypothetical protein